MNREDQENIWIPFHFLPGNEGTEYEERLLCRQNSKLARRMLGHHIEWRNRKAYRMLIGIAAHVYADTFAHYGFNGISSVWNEVKLETLQVENERELGRSVFRYVSDKMQRWIDEKTGQAQAQFAETATWGLGHAGAATFPDRPFLVWSMEYENTEHKEREGKKERNNPDTFLDGARALHEFFHRVQDTGRVESDGIGMEWGKIEKNIDTIIRKPGKEEQRITTWRKAARDGTLFENGGERIPQYLGLRWETRKGQSMKRVTYKEVVEEPWFQFYQAAAVHRTYVLRDLLPSAGLAVS